MLKNYSTVLYFKTKQWYSNLVPLLLKGKGAGVTFNN